MPDIVSIILYRFSYGFKVNSHANASFVLAKISLASVSFI
jgi:hypothetical protein